MFYQHLNQSFCRCPILDDSWASCQIPHFIKDKDSANVQVIQQLITIFKLLKELSNVADACKGRFLYANNIYDVCLIVALFDILVSPNFL